MDGDLARRIAETWEPAGSLATTADLSLRLATVPDGTWLEQPATASVSRIDADADADYRVAERLGRGGMGDVHAAWQSRVGRRVALKRVRPDRVDDPDLERRFRAEASVTGTLEHPGIVPVYDLGTDTNGHAFLAMQLVAGRPWSASIRSMTLDDNLATLRRVAEAVSFAHARGFIHLDLKPANVLLGDWGEVLLCDWGLAMRIEGGLARPLCPGASIGGTPCYMAPEQALHDQERLGPATDVYLLGAILYEILCGRRVHDGSDARACLVAAATNQVVPPGGDPELEDLALRALATDPRQRPATVDAFLADLGRWRIHADSNALLARARELTHRCQAGDLTAGADALRAITEARHRWPEQPHADACEHTLRRSWAAAALAQGDAALAVAVAPPDPSLRSTAQAQLDAQRQQARRLRRSRATLILLAVLLLAGLGVGWWLVERSAATARRHQAEAEAALADSHRAAYRAQLAQAVTACQSGDRIAALAALTACPSDLHDLEWQVLRTKANETAQRIPGHDRPTQAVCWDPDGRHLWLGTSAAVVQVDPLSARVRRRHDLPAATRTLAVRGETALAGTHAGAWLLEPDCAEPRAVPVSGTIQQVALNDSRDCLLLIAGTAWRWHPDLAQAERLLDGVTAVAWEHRQPVLATRTQVLVGGQVATTQEDFRIQALLWTPEHHLLLGTCGPELLRDGTWDDTTKPVSGRPDTPTWQLRTRDGRVLASALQFYLECGPAIACDGRGFALIEPRYQSAILHGHGMQRLRFSENVHGLAWAPDGRLAVASDVGVAIHEPAAPTALIESIPWKETLAATFDRNQATVLRCDGAVTWWSGDSWRATPKRSHLKHRRLYPRLTTTPIGIVVLHDDGPQHLVIGQPAKDLLRVKPPPDAETFLTSPSGTHVAVNLPQQRLLIVATSDTALPEERSGHCDGWLDDRHLLVHTPQASICLSLDGAVRWRIPSLNPNDLPAQALVLGDHFAYAVGSHLTILNRADGTRVHTLDRHTLPIQTMAWSGSRLITGDQGGNLAFWDPHHDQPIAFIPWTENRISALAATRDRLVVGSSDSRAYLWGEP